MSMRGHWMAAMVAAMFFGMCGQMQGVERPKLAAEKWSGEVNVPDPVACSVDDQGRVYVSSTARRQVADLDIRNFRDWVADDQSFQTIEDKAAFYRRVLGPGVKGLKDLNGDGAVDWKDLTTISERIYRLEDSKGEGKADRILTFAEGFQTEVTGIAAGVLAFGGSVYTTIAPDLWRLSEKNGRESLVHGFGLHIAYAGHDMHGLRVGPDGRIYWTIGDKGLNVVSKEGRRFFYPNEGCVMRCEPDGSGFEVFAHGLRNVQETDFNEVGDLFGVDNDADKAGEKERLVFIAEGSDSGWRCGYQYMKGWCPWTDEGRWQPGHRLQPLFMTPPIANSHDGPSGFVYNPGTALSEAWRGWFFLNQFPSGKMNAMRVEADGASWKLAEDVLVESGVRGVGMSWGPEGKLYFVDWAGGYPLKQKGAVWTLDAAVGDRDPLRAEVKQRLNEGFAKLEVPELQQLLAHADVRLRRGAQFELVARGGWEALLGSARNSSKLGRLHAIWGLGQGLRRGQWTAVGELTGLLQDAEPEVRAQTAKVLGEAPVQPAVAAALVSLIDDSNARVRFHAAQACGRLKLPKATAALLAAARSAGEPWTRHALVSGLAGCAKSEELVAGAGDESRAVRVACLLALARKGDPAVAVFLKDADPQLVAEAAIAIHDDVGIPPALGKLAAWLASAPAQSSPVALRRAINANYRIGGAECAARLAAFATGSGGPVSERSEALALLVRWVAPAPLDRVDGRYRKLPARPQSEVRDVLKVNELLAMTAPELRAPGLELLKTFHLNAPTDQVAAVVADAKKPVADRIEALRLLVAQDPKELGRLLESVLAEEKFPGLLRGEALQVLAKRDARRAMEIARSWVSAGRSEEQQAAWKVLGEMATAEADAAIAGGLDSLAAGQAWALELLEAAAARAPKAKEVSRALKGFEARREGALAGYEECLEGGNVEAGKEVAQTNISSNCTACHRFAAGAGSEVGPLLAGIGARLDRRSLLEALIAPGAKVASGYGLVSLTTKSGESISATLLEDGATALLLRLADGKNLKVEKSQVATQTPPISVMPPMGSILSKRQLRDVVAYLNSLKP